MKRWNRENIFLLIKFYHSKLFFRLAFRFFSRKRKDMIVKCFLRIFCMKMPMLKLWHQTVKKKTTTDVVLISITSETFLTSLHLLLNRLSFKWASKCYINLHVKCRVWSTKFNVILHENNEEKHSHVYWWFLLLVTVTFAIFLLLNLEEHFFQNPFAVFFCLLNSAFRAPRMMLSRMKTMRRQTFLQTSFLISGYEKTTCNYTTHISPWIQLKSPNSLSFWLLLDKSCAKSISRLLSESLSLVVKSRTFWYCSWSLGDMFQGITGEVWGFLGPQSLISASMEKGRGTGRVGKESWADWISVGWCPAGNSMACTRFRTITFPTKPTAPTTFNSDFWWFSIIIHSQLLRTGKMSVLNWSEGRNATPEWSWERDFSWGRHGFGLKPASMQPLASIGQIGAEQSAELLRIFITSN